MSTHASSTPASGAKAKAAVATAAAPLRRFGESAIATRANAFTIARLVLTAPVLLLIVVEGASWVTVTGWVVLACTDGVDGWLARRDGTTRSGAFLDPIADKFLVLGGFVALGIRGDFAWVAVALVAARELGVSAFRSLAGRRGISLPARQLGKWKANVQFAAVVVVLFPPTADATALQSVVLWVAVAITLLSGLDIVRRGWQESHA
jgi:CDP-diacylglycerol--glycerol-3-phosphate 3-phosphatidyltransferase